MKQSTTPSAARATQVSSMSMPSKKEASTQGASVATPLTSITVGLDLGDRYSQSVAGRQT